MDAEQNQEATQEQPETPEPEAPEAPEGEQPEAPPEEPAEEGKEPEADAEEGEEEKATAAAEEKQKRAQKGGWQRKAERAQRDAEQARRERDALLERLTAQQPAQPAAPDNKEKTPAEQAKELFQSIVREELDKEREAERAARQRAEFAKQAEEARDEHEDYDDVIRSVSHVPVPAVVNQAILTSGRGPAIMYQLASNPAELARISALPPLEAALEIGALAAKLAASTATPVKPKSAARPPAPPTSVAGSSPSTRNLEDLPIAEYKRAIRSGRR